MKTLKEIREERSTLLKMDKQSEELETASYDNVELSEEEKELKKLCIEQCKKVLKKLRV